MRLFVALMMPPAIADVLVDVQEGIAGANWVDPDDFHLTLRFLGDLDRPDAEDVAEALAQIEAPVVRLRLRGLDVFEGAKRVTTVWAVPEPTSPLRHLAAKVDRACHAAGQPLERRAYRPHVTLARCRGCDPREIGALLQRHGDVATPFVSLEAMWLVSAQLGRDGPHYTPLAAFKLGDGEPVEPT